MLRGIHPGHCAVVFDGGAAVQLFPPQEGGLPAFVQLVNSELKAKTVHRWAGCMLQLSRSIEETLLFNGSQSTTTAPKSANLPLFSKHSIGDGDATVAYKMERHAEVNAQ